MSGLRLGIVGATGILGREFVGLLDADDLAIDEVRLFADDRSLGEDVDFRGQVVSVRAEAVNLTGLDAVVVCAPASTALEVVREALRAEVPCIDCSGVLTTSDEVPLAIADLGADDRLAAAPLITSPPGPTLVWAPVLAALQREAGLVSARGTILQSASAFGRAGIETLSQQTIALLNQRPLAEPPILPGPVAFDCLPASDTDGEDKQGEAAQEAGLRLGLRRLLGPEIELAVTAVHVPTFAGQGSALTAVTERRLDPDRASAVLATAPGIDPWPDDPPSTRDAVGRDEVLVGRIRPDPTVPDGLGLQLWLAGDPVRLAAANAVKLLRARFPDR